MQVDAVALGGYLAHMRSVGIKVLNSKLSECVRLAASGATVLVTDHDNVVAESGPPRRVRPVDADRLGAAAQACSGCQPGRGSGRTRRDQARKVIYLDKSVALAWLLTEDRQPPVSVRDGTVGSSRLLEFEIWTLLQSRGTAESHGEAGRQIVGRVALN